ncbi:MAG TPA: hypothetical protein VF941_14955 [Clostridia bacterium]
MASHFSSIGLNVTEQKDFENYFELAYQNGEKIKTKLGTYVKWHIGDGIELWGQLDSNNMAVGMNPHFSGTSRIKIRACEKIKRDNDSVLDGALYCWAAPDESGEGQYPFVFDIPDMAAYGDVDLPKIFTAQITGFAHEISAYKDDEEFEKSQETKPKFASESFIPAGLFSPDGNETVPPRAMAVFTGHVIETRTVTNQHTNLEFIYARIKTLGGEFDIVVDPHILEGRICVNGVVSGMFWLSGRLIEDDITKKEEKDSKFSFFKLFKK